MKIKKGTTWLVGIADLTVLFIFTALFAKEALPTIGPFIILSIAGACFGYQVANVADNALKGKYYRPELAEERGGAAQASAPQPRKEYE